MTQEEKQLVLMDLCARLPYGIKVLYNEINCVIENIGRDGSISLISDDSTHKKAIYLTSIEYIKPYLCPMSSMTKEETFDYYKNSIELGCIPELPIEPRTLATDWLNKHHFDYRRLIEKGLALETPNGIYK